MIIIAKSGQAITAQDALQKLTSEIHYSLIDKYEKDRILSISHSIVFGNGVFIATALICVVD